MSSLTKSLGTSSPTRLTGSLPPSQGGSQTSRQAEVVSLTNWDWLHPSLARKYEVPTVHFHFHVPDGPLAFDDSDLTELEDLNGRLTSLSPPNGQGKTQKAKAKHD